MTREISGRSLSGRRSRPRYRTRVHAYVPGGQGRTLRRAEHPSLHDRALVLHVEADKRDRLALSTTRELAGYTSLDEVLYAPEGAVSHLRVYGVGRRPDVPLGVLAQLEPRPIEKLGPLITDRFYGAPRIPLVAWDLPWTLGRITGHVGPLRGSADGFSTTLLGCGVRRDDGRWVDSWLSPRFRLSPQGSAQLGCFISCGVPFDKASRYLGRRRLRPVDLQVLSSALAGTEFSSARQACELYRIPWPGPGGDATDRFRAETGALVQLYRFLVAELDDVAPGLAPDRVWSTGGLITWGFDRPGRCSWRQIVGHRALPSRRDGVRLLWGAHRSALGRRGRLDGTCGPVEAYAACCLFSTSAAITAPTTSRSKPSTPRRSDGSSCPGHGATIGPRGDIWGRIRSVRPHGALALPSTSSGAPTTPGSRWRRSTSSGRARTFHGCDIAAAVEEGADAECLDIMQCWRLTATGRQWALRGVHCSPAGC